MVRDLAAEFLAAREDRLDPGDVLLEGRGIKVASLGIDNLAL